MPLTVSQFYAQIDQFRQAVADAAGVSIDQVRVINVTASEGIPMRRSSGLGANTKSSSCLISVDGRWSMMNLNKHLIKRGLPPSTRRMVLGRRRQLITKTVSGMLLDWSKK
jgi:hypothetical protein